MIKSELIQEMSAKFPHLQEKDVAESVNMLFELMSETLAHNGRIEIRGFGSFNLHYRPPRRAHNPKTGEKLMTQAKHSPHFKPGKEMRERVNGSRHLPIKEETQVEEE